MRKKGQVTVFIVLAVVIVIVFLLLTTLKSNTRIDKVKTGPVPESFEPIKQFIEMESKESLSEALFSSGEFCGIVDPKDYDYGEADDPTESLVVKPFSGDRICPYWHFLASSNNCEEDCVYGSLKPPLNSEFKNGRLRKTSDYSIEAQFDRYIKKNLQKLDFKDFEYQGYDVKRSGEVVVTTLISDTIKVVINYPVLAEKDNEKYEMKTFVIEDNFNFKELYEISEAITDAENDKRFLEQFTLSLLSVYSELDEDKLPPLSRRVEFGKTPMYWPIIDAKQDFRNNILSKVNAIQVLGSKGYSDETPVPGAVLELDDFDLSDYEIMFTPLYDKPFYFAINGMTDGTIGGSTSISDLIMFKFSMNDYWMSYDVSYPVMVTLKTEKNGQPYQMQFALEANVRNNQPLFQNAVLGNVDSKKTMMCESEQKLSGNIVIKTKDSYGYDISDVDLFYKCGETGCFVGKTDSDGYLKTKLPLCVNGVLIPNKEGFVSNYELISTQKNKGENVRLELSELKEFQIDAKKLIFEKEENSNLLEANKWLYKSSDTLKPEIGPIDNDEELIITFKRVNTDGEVYEIPVIFTPGTLQKVFLSPGEYEVEVLLFKDKELFIPETNGVLGIGKMNSTIISKGHYGGLNLNSNSGYFEITPEDFENSDSITIYSVYFDLFSIDDPKYTDLSVINDIESLSKRYREMLEPRIK
jgi:hypothetical protein